MADGPDPSDDEATSEPLADSVKESVLVVLLADTGREHGAESGPEDVEDEHGEGGAGFELHNGLLALGARIVSLSFSGFGHSFRDFC